MAKLVGQHQQSSFTSPSNGDRPIDATVVKGNDNSMVTIHNAHDNNETVHVQSGTTGEKPAAGTVGRCYYDTTLKRWEYDTGSEWVTSNFSSGPLASRPAASSVAAGSIYFDTTNFVFTYSDGATWTSIVPGSGVTGGGTTGNIPVFSGATSLGNSGLRSITRIGRTFIVAGSEAAGEVLELVSHRHARGKQFFRLDNPRGLNTAATLDDFTTSNHGGIYSISVTNFNATTNGLRIFDGGATTEAYWVIFSYAVASAYQPTTEIFSRDNGCWMRYAFRLTSGQSASATPTLYSMGFANNSPPWIASNVSTLPNANTIHSMWLQFDNVSGYWRLVLSDGTNNVYQSYNIVTDTLPTDGDYYDIWFGVDPGTTVYRWCIVKNGTILSESSYDASAMRNPGASTHLIYNGVGINHTAATPGESVCPIMAVFSAG